MKNSKVRRWRCCGSICFATKRAYMVEAGLYQGWDSGRDCLNYLKAKRVAGLSGCSRSTVQARVLAVGGMALPGSTGSTGSPTTLLLKGVSFGIRIIGATMVIMDPYAVGTARWALIKPGSVR
jgi:hypothetical protein